MGRRPDNREPRWIKPRSQDTVIGNRVWLYGIDKAARWVKHYQTIIIVEGIFDYFAFYRLLQDTHKPFVVSTLGTHLDNQATTLFQSFGVKNIIVAFDWDDAGKAGIKRISEKLGGQVYYLGGLMPDEDPAEKLGDLLNSISGFSMGRLTSAAKDLQRRTEKQVMVSILSRGSAQANELIFKPDGTIDHAAMPAPRTDSNARGKHLYDRDRFLPLLTYNHGNKAALEAKLQTLIKMMNEKNTEPSDVQAFHIYSSFINEVVPFTAPAIDLAPSNKEFHEKNYQKNRYALLSELRCISGIPEIASKLSQNTLYKLVSVPEGGRLYKDGAGKIKGVFTKDGKILKWAEFEAIRPSFVKAATAVGSQILLISIAMQLNRVEKGISRILDEIEGDRIAEIRSGVNQYKQAMIVQDSDRQSRMIEHAIQSLNTGIEKSIGPYANWELQPPN